MKKPKLVIMVGNIGSGKSTYVKKLVEQGHVVICKDAIRYMIGAGSYIFNPDYEDIIHENILIFVFKLMENKNNIIIDETNMDEKTRGVYLSLAGFFEYETEAIIMSKLSMAESVKRRLGANHGNTPKEVWEEVYKRKEQAYQKPTKEEGFNIITEIKL